MGVNVMKNNYIYILGTSVVAFLMFLIVVFITSGERGQLLDQSVMSLIDDKSSAGVLKFMELISMLGSTELMLLLTIALLGILIVKKERFHFLFLAVVSLGGVILNFVVKFIIHRERPGGEIKDIELFDFNFSIPSYSFPSGHTMRVTILFIFLMYMCFYYVKKSLIRYIAYVSLSVLLVLVAVSRLFLDAHFFSDVIGALFLGAAWFYGMFYLFKRIQMKYAEPHI